ncbi:2-hydroxyacid dehydrogenase [Planotetraspora thailandica]|nr:NAD(P)-dependent oxidoreductase [Planotetraspora thailandica]
MKKRRVVITGAAFPAEIARVLEAHGLVIEAIPGTLDRDEIVSTLSGAWGYVQGGSERMTKDVWQKVPELAVICFMGTGYHSFMQLPENPVGMQFTYTPHANAEAVAEFTIALMLDMTRRVTERANEVRAGGWSEVATPSLIGARVGIAGMGRIGQEVARMASSAFGARVAYWNRSIRPELRGLGYTRADSIRELCAQVDLLSLGLAYKPGDNDGVIAEEELTLLGGSGILVNTARAELVDPVALREALMAGRIAGAAMDGYYIEPTPEPHDDPYGLLAMTPRLLVTPHCAYLSHQAVHRMAAMAAENLLAVLEQRVPPYPVPALGTC